MWRVFPKVGLLKALFFVVSVILFASLALLFPNDQSRIALSSGRFSDILDVVVPVSSIFVLVIYVIGKWGWLLFWKFPFLGGLLDKHVCPDLNGLWEGQVISNFRDENHSQVTIVVNLRIKADLFGFRVDLTSRDGYQNSKVVQSELYRDPRTNVFYISYIFEANVPVPKETDDRIFDGAAKLEVIVDEGSTELKGTYWTNRSWHRRLNTAGLISISRVGS